MSKAPRRPLQQVDLLDQSNEERIARIRRERWIGYPAATKAVERLTALLTWPARQRMPNLLIIGPTNNGKSMIVERFRRLHTPTTDSDAEIEAIPIVAMQMPADPSASRFYGMLLSTVGVPLKYSGRRTQALEHQALGILRTVGARMLLIDELHNVLAGSPKAQREFLNLLRFLGNELRIPIVGVGTKEAYLAIRSDDQLENRFEPLVLPQWKSDENMRSLLASFSEAFPLKRKSHLGTKEMAEYVISRTDGTIGEIAKFLSAAAILAIETGEEALTSKILARTDYQSPTERRRAFERVYA